MVCVPQFGCTNLDALDGQRSILSADTRSCGEEGRQLTCSGVAPMASGKSAPSFKGELCLRRISVKVRFPAIAALWRQPDIRLKGTLIGFLPESCD